MLGFTLVQLAIATLFSLPAQQLAHASPISTSPTTDLVVYNPPINLTTYHYPGTTGLSKRESPSAELKIALITQNTIIVGAAATCLAAGLAWPICIGSAIFVLALNYFTVWDPFSLFRRELETTRNYTQHVHAEWYPVGECNTFCRLTKETAEETWTPFGNTTVNGIFHDVHFVHYGNIAGLRAWQGGYPGDAAAGKMLKERQEETNYDGAVVDFYFSEGSETSWDSFVTDDGATSTDDMANWVASSIEEFSAANDGVVMCVDMEDDDGVVNAGLWTIWANTPYAISVSDAVNDVNNNCVGEE